MRHGPRSPSRPALLGCVAALGLGACGHSAAKGSRAVTPESAAVTLATAQAGHAMPASKPLTKSFRRALSELQVLCQEPLRQVPSEIERTAKDITAHGRSVTLEELTEDLDLDASANGAHGSSDCGTILAGYAALVDNGGTITAPAPAPQQGP